MSFVVLGSGMQLLVLYGWPALAQQSADKCQLHSDIPVDSNRDDVTWTTDRDTRGRAYYKLAISTHPIVFQRADDAQYTIDRFQIPGARPEPWR
jgi:hypothetical protein